MADEIPGGPARTGPSPDGPSTAGDETLVGGPAAGGDGPRKKRRVNPIVELVVLVAIALGLALGIQALVVKPYQIPSESMLPTLKVGQRVLVDRISERLGADPQVGDIVVFHPPKGAEPSESGLSSSGDAVCRDRRNIEQGRPCAGAVGGEWGDENFIKRVVAGPGDTIAVRDGHVIRNGKRVDEPYIARSCEGAGEGTACNLPKPIRVPEGMYYMMGDNRGGSNDSRYWGPVPRDWIVGGAFATYWPPKEIGGL